MSKIESSREDVERQHDRSWDLPQQESAILRANMRYFGNVGGAPEHRNRCETAIRGALNRYFKVDIAE